MESVLHLVLQARAMAGRSRRRQHEAAGNDARGLSVHFFGCHGLAACFTHSHVRTITIVE
ncbi:hypothetical protein [Streptomyces sp. NPDC000351]|uniref:hypothetical protein n=1 Tax=Streptomyces sp. NPDC000351 TaxID=3154250 RepID=UPI003317ABF5